MAEGGPVRDFEDLLRVVRALAFAFDTDTVYIVGSQAILASMSDAPEATRQSPEIDAFPANAKVWEMKEAKHTRDGVQPIASEHIDGLFGSESQFHRTHGFYIDGVDETTAKLPRGWLNRAVRVQTEVGGRTVTGVAPALEDLVVSKLARLDDRDKRFVSAIHGTRPLDLELIEQRIRKTDLDPTVAEQAIAYVRSLASEG
ncbi:DUF6036 family nucleotidyltransferase [Bradyrhizobium sp.]|uniref:DUF6036 family nucleotidyltransferase n=1 Tax=Bradyrhizobium sp. TaxID=376 RepID=UPI0007C962C0|nr:DUF6036 family nucleotidyltransferase [Bradyrhizobium sp.]